MRKSIAPTYDHRETGDRYTVQSWVGQKNLGATPTRDPFVTHTIHVGWVDLLRGLLRLSLAVRVTVDGDPDIVNDVMELDADCLVAGSTRRAEFGAQLQDALARFPSAAGSRETRRG